MEIKQILEILKNNNIQYIEKVYQQKSTNEIHVICRFPNGRIYTYYNALEKNVSLAGTFKSVEDAQEKLLQDNPSSVLIWENAEEDNSRDLDITYITHFTLTTPVNDFDAAYEYLTEDDMTEYLIDDKTISKSARDKIEKIEWILQGYQAGIIEVKTNNYLTDEESQEVSEWIKGQCSDGLGEGFEQQDFANYREYEDEWDSWTENEDYAMTSFDWYKNDYELLLQE